MRTHLFRMAVLTVLCLGVAPAVAQAQYFGQNKVQRRTFKFSVLETAHFNIYYYPEEADAAKEIARMAERWYARLATIFSHELTGRQPVVLYASHPEFEQTNVIEGPLGEGTGGVTEGGLRRIVLPMAASLADSNHVIGHELVHAFQYDILGRNNAATLPLWMIEGMAEYLSIGPRDPQTAMWLRDAALEDHLPTIADLDNPKFFPYRFGHAFWAYVTGRWGDKIIGQMFQAMSDVTAGADPIKAIESITKLDRKTLAADWHKSIRQTYDIASGGARPSDQAGLGVVVDPRKDRGRLAVGPALSPDGQRVAFLSERSRLSIDLYLADATTGRVIRRLVSTASDPHFDSLQFLASAGTWSPDGRRLVVATVENGQAALAMIDADSGNRLEEIPFPSLGEIFQPSWSPDGKAIAFSGQGGGFTDLYVYSLDSRQTRRLTNDSFADLQPAWSPDGRRLAFVTERYSTNLLTLTFGGLDLATLSMDDGQMTRVDTGLEGNAVGPQWSQDGRWLYFTSDTDGRPNVYRADASTGQAARLTAVITGIAGVTPRSPALSMAAGRDRMAVTLFRDSGYEIHVVETPSALADIAPVGDDLAQLPPVSRVSNVVVDQQQAPLAGLPAASSFATKSYRPGMKLVSVGQQAGVITSQFGTFIGGGVALGFSDMLGEHLLGTTANINGGAKDIGASATYINRTSRWNWGVFAERAPLLSGGAASGFGTLNGQTVFVQQTELFRQTITQAGALTAYPFSRAARIEFSGDVQKIGFDDEVRTQAFDPITGALVLDKTENLPVAAALRLADTTAAIVRDTSTFGATGPVLGQRLRLDVSQTFGDLQFTTVTADFRQYVMPIQPITFAGRLLHVARYGTGGEDQRLLPLFLGYPTLVRGYDARSFSASECTVTNDGSCPEFDRLLGSRIIVASGEVRAPAMGLFTGRLQYGPLPVDLLAFADAGVAWTSTTSPTFAGGSRPWVTSVGVGARFNLFGVLIGELDLARPLQRPGRGFVWVFSFKSGF